MSGAVIKNEALTAEGGFPPGASIECQFRDGTWRTAKVIERKAIGGDPRRGFRYYVHYIEFNRRMDEWVDDKRVRPPGALFAEAEARGLKHGRHDGEQATGGQLGSGAGTGSTAVTPAAVEEEAAPAVERGPDGEVLQYIEPDHNEHEGMDEASIREHEEVTKVKNINMIEVGRYQMETWYFSPYPKEYYPDGSIETMFLCEFCLDFFSHKTELRRHIGRCYLRHPPGTEIYRDGNLSYFEVDGAREKQYCQNLCYLAKLFLDHKTLFYDVDPFLFYVLCESDDRGYHIVGYFSKEKYSEQGYNLACILTLPAHQRKGYGAFLIDFSYALSKKEEKVGSPEKPLSDLGLLSYRSYWTRVLLAILKDVHGRSLSIMDLAKLTSIKPEDIISTLQYHGLVRYYDGQHILAVPPKLIEEKCNTKLDRGPKVDMDKLHWAPYRLVDIKKDKWAIRAKREVAED